MSAHLFCCFFKREALFKFEEGGLAEGVYAEAALGRAFGVFAFCFGVAVGALVLVFYEIYDLSGLSVGEFFYYVVFDV